MKTNGTECPNCEGTGWTFHPGTGGAMPCKCYDEFRIHNALVTAGVPEKYTRKTISGYNPISESEIAAVAAIRYWLDSYPKPKDYDGPRGLLLSGNTGNGKTHLLCAIGKRLIALNTATPLFRNSSDLLRNEQARFGDDTIPSEFDAVVACDLLLLDDLGAEHAKEFGIRFLGDVLNARYSHDRATVVTTNYTPSQIATTYGDRFMSRLFDMCEHLRFDGPSRRQGA